MKYFSESSSLNTVSRRLLNVPADADEWHKWAVTDGEMVEPCPSTVQLAIRWPNGQQQRVRMWKAAPISVSGGGLICVMHNTLHSYLGQIHFLLSLEKKKVNFGQKKKYLYTKFNKT